MHLDIDTEKFRVPPGKNVRLTDFPTKVDPFFESKKEYKQILKQYRKEIFELQNMMYAHDKYSLLLIFQGMDTAGKDGAIKHVMSGINPAGVRVSSFKRPSDNELDHDFMWRCYKELPARGIVGIFNRSYYEEVLVVKVHPEILFSKKIPEEYLRNDASFWNSRYEDIVNMEKHLRHNGTHTVKFFIHISKEEQRQRFMDRIDEPDKNWKLSKSDITERGYWDKYQEAYEDCVNNCSTEFSPWYIIPGDSKKNARIIIAQIVLKHMRKMNVSYPQVSDQHKAELASIRELLISEKEIQSP